MINNLLKAVGGSAAADNAADSSTHSSAGSGARSEANGNDGEKNLASTIGGLLNNFQETFQLDGKAVVAGALDSTGVMNHKSWKGGGGGRYKNVGGRGYYTDGTVDRRRREAAAQQQQGVGDSGQRQGRGQKQKGKPMNPAANEVYQGRKMVSDIAHLYQVVDDKQAYENYDALMEVTSNAATEATERMTASDHSSGGSSVGSGRSRRGGGRRGGGHSSSRESSQEQKQNWARMKEEELVDRMLSQFPEYGTCRPTPFTVMDEDDEKDDDDGGNSIIKPHEGHGAKNDGMGRNVNTVGGTQSAMDAGSNANGTANTDNPYSPSRFFTDDASELIGRFFFGTPNNNDASNASATGPAAANGSAAGEGRANANGADDFKRSASFGSASTMSTMTATTGTGRNKGNVANNQQRGDLGQSSDHASTMASNVDIANSTNADIGDSGKDYASVWDQDEIDLWTAKPAFTVPGRQHRGIPGTVYNAGGAALTASTAEPRSSKDATPSSQRQINDGVSRDPNQLQEGQAGQAMPADNWASRRRKHRERRKKRQDWDALRVLDAPSGPQLVVTSNILADPSMDMSQFRPQGTLLTALADREPPKPSTGENDSQKQGETDKQREKGAGGGVGGAVIVDDGKQHWMPDNLCKHCYSCEAPFTLIRRKHHCRVCGMIFCSACSAYFVQISSSSDGKGGGTTSDAKQGGAGTMRTCKMCYDHLTERGLGVVMRGGVGSTDIKKPDAQQSLESDPIKKHTSSLSADGLSEVGSKGVTTPSMGLRKGSARDILMPLASSSKSDSLPEVVEEEKTASSPAGTSSELTDQFSGFQGAGGASVSGDFHALSITKQRLDEERRRREERERAEAEAARLADAEAAAALAEQQAKSGTTGGRLKSRLSVRQLKWKSSSNLEPKEAEEETINADSNAVEVSVGGASDSEGALAAGEATARSAPEGVRSVSSMLESSSGIEEALLLGPGENKDAKISAKIHLGMVAADYLEKLGRELLQTDAPLLLEEIKAVATAAGSKATVVESKLTDTWVNTLMTLATRCCATVEPDVKNGDLLDIRPYCKVKCIPGGSVEDSAYLSGIVFRKNVSHKKMSRTISNAKIMMLSGGIEYTRAENRIASIDTLLEQEERYMEILISKIARLKPDVLIVGKSVCRKAQELLLRANISLIQYVKASLMSRIARQTGATVLASIDHVMNSTILGFCRRFRLVSFRNNDVWFDDDAPTRAISAGQKSVTLLLSKKIPNHERQAALAARRLGEGVLDGKDAVTCGLAKRGVVESYVMIEGCPKELGCTVVLRGASRPALKMIKRVLRFLINCSYNMKLETSYILERCCRLPPSYKIPTTPCCSSSLCVDFGQPPHNRKARPWNGGKNDPAQRSLSGKITPLDHQAILITSVWMTEKTQCCPAEVKGICYYSQQDVSLGQFLRDSCFNLSLKCQNPSCKKSVIDHSLSFIHGDGLINISVERMDNPIPTSSLEKQPKELDSSSTTKQETPADYEPIATWTFCTKCNQVVTPLIFLSEQTWRWSFGKFLEVYFYNRDACINAPGHRCSCRMQTFSQLFFGCGSLAARFTYEKISPYSVFCRRHLPFDESFHRTHSLQDLEHISVTSSSLFVKYDKQIEAISRETRELFGSAMNKPEHLQAVLSELNLVSAEVDNASKVLSEKITSVTAKYSKSDSGKRSNEYNEALFNFPWYSRRYLFMLASAWNERLSAAGQALVAMKKIQNAGGTSRGDSAGVVPAIVGDASAEDVIEGMKRIRILQDTYSKSYNVAKMTMPRGNKAEGGLFEGNILPDGRVATLEEAEIDDEEFYSDPDNDIDFEDDVDADVLASRNRVYSPRASSSSKRSSRHRPKKVLGGKRASDMNMAEEPMIPDQSQSLAFANNYDSSGQLQLEAQGKSKTVTSGVKSALNRFFNRGGNNNQDPYIVDLGYFGQGRPRLQPGVGGLVMPVFDDQPSTIIAHSLASSDYDVQFKQFLNATSQPEKHEPSRKDIERRMLGRNKSHIKHTFRDFDEKGQQLCKFVCTTFWSVQFNAVRQAFMNPHLSSKDSGDSGSARSSGASRLDIEKSYIRSLATSFAWAASGGKSGAAFSRTTDDRFVIKCISRTELQMFLDCAPAYFEYLSKAFFHGLPTVLCKIVGVYQIGYHNRVTGRRTMEQVAVMQNIFYGRKISKIFDLKGSLRGRFTRQSKNEKEKKSSKANKHYARSRSDGTSDSDSYSSGDEKDDDSLSTSSGGIEKDAEEGDKPEKSESIPTLLDGDFLEFTSGRPLPLTDRAKAVFHMSILNDTLFLSIINVLDYSILVGLDQEKMELVVGIIDFMRQYDILKQMERVGKSLPMVVGSEAPTIIQPPLYKARFTNAMERYFMTVPSKWTTI